jgi:hypothetical protein
MIKMVKSTRAIPTAAPATPVKPNAPAMRATIKNVSVQLNINTSRFFNFYFFRSPNRANGFKAKNLSIQCKVQSSHILHRALKMFNTAFLEKSARGAILSRPLTSKAYGTGDAEIRNMKTKILLSIAVAGFTAMCYGAGGSAGGSAGPGGAAGTPGSSGIAVPGNIPGPNGTTVGSSDTAKHTVRAAPKRINTPGAINDNINANGTVNQNGSVNENGNVNPSGTVNPNATINNANGTVSNPNGMVNGRRVVKVPSHKVITTYGNVPANNNNDNNANNPPDGQQ